MSTQPTQTTLLFLGTEADRSYLPYLKPYVGTHKCFINLKPVTTLYEVESYCRERGITSVITTRQDVLAKLSGRDKPSIDNLAGSWFIKNNIEYVPKKLVSRLLALA